MTLKTTPQHFKIFKAAAKVWEGVLGLGDWDVNYYHEDCGNPDEGLAFCNADAFGRVVTITLNKQWPSHVELSRERLSQCAFHELCHVLLAELVAMAKNHITDSSQLTQAQHAVIRRLEKMVLK